MKKLFLIFFILPIFLLHPQNIFAVSETPTPTPDFAQRVASFAAELHLTSRRGIIGTITDISDTRLTLADLNNNVRLVDVDELTKFSSPSAKESFGLSDLTKGTKVGVLGLYNKDSRRLLARFIDVLPLVTTLHGAVYAIDNKNYAITVVSNNNEQYDVDIETTTRTFSYTSGQDILSRSGFSKITTGEHIVIKGAQDPHDRTHLTAMRVILFPDIPKNPKITIQIPEPASQSATKTP